MKKRFWGFENYNFDEYLLTIKKTQNCLINNKKTDKDISMDLLLTQLWWMDAESINEIKDISKYLFILLSYYSIHENNTDHIHHTDHIMNIYLTALLSDNNAVLAKIQNQLIHTSKIDVPWNYRVYNIFYNSLIAVLMPNTTLNDLKSAIADLEYIVKNKEKHEAIFLVDASSKRMLSFELYAYYIACHACGELLRARIDSSPSCLIKAINSFNKSLLPCKYVTLVTLEPSLRMLIKVLKLGILDKYILEGIV